MSCPRMLRRVAEDAGPLVRMLGGLGVEPKALVHRHPGELAQAIQNYLECLDHEDCQEMVSHGGSLSQAPGFCSNRTLIAELMEGATASDFVMLKSDAGRPISRDH